jgi:hypothetical protein
MSFIPETDLVLSILRTGKIHIEAQFLNSSNFTFLGIVDSGDHKLRAVYKPQRGEQQLWDFPVRTLARREVAAFELSQALGWGLVPPTVIRHKDVPAGPGSLQVYIDHDPNLHYFTFSPEQRQSLRFVVVFDLLANNADRKGGHILLDDQGHNWLIDHGVCFHVEDKLRTVVWDFAGEPIPATILRDIERVAVEIENNGPAFKSLNPLLKKAEVIAVALRARRLLEVGSFPFPDKERRPFPWPPI